MRQKSPTKTGGNGIMRNLRFKYPHKKCGWLPIDQQVSQCIFAQSALEQLYAYICYIFHNNSSVKQVTHQWLEVYSACEVTKWHTSTIAIENIGRDGKNTWRGRNRNESVHWWVTHSTTRKDDRFHQFLRRRQRVGEGGKGGGRGRGGEGWRIIMFIFIFLD